MKLLSMVQDIYPANLILIIGNSMNKQKGMITWFDDKLGFGFIKKKSGLLIYVHYKDIKTEGHRYFRKNDKVCFEEYRNEEGLRAKNVNSDVTHRYAWRYAKYRMFRKFLYWLTKRKSIRYMWCLNHDGQYVSLIRYYLFTSKWMDIYVHQFMNDDEKIWHNHPWRFISFTISGEYYEDYPTKSERRKVRKGTIIFRGKGYKHRTVLDETYKGKTFTLVITGKRKNEWSYYDSQENKLSTEDYAKKRGMEIKVYKEGLLRGTIFPRWEFADFKPAYLPSKDKS